MDFEWGEKKASKNERKHGISFDEATEVFGDDYSSCVSDPDHSQDEERFLLFGVSEKGKHLVISFTETEYAIRIISARHMTPPERKAYEQR
jgi:uncharacterized DUF497 family protein